MMVNGNAFDAPPPGAGLTTVTFATPTLAMSVAGIWAVNSVALENVVGRGLPFQFTTAPFTNALPFAVKLNAGPPTAAVFCVRLVRTGTGFGGVMVKIKAFDAPPPGAGLTTITLDEP